MNQKTIKNICVFCGASVGSHPEYTVITARLGQILAQQGRRIIYGGGNRGLMGVLANAALAAGGEIIGVIPEKLVEAETAHKGITHLEIVADMHTRKARMSELADAFVALPGGIGTLEELFEVWTWSQIGYHRKPVGLMDIKNYYHALLAFLHHATNDGFITPEFMNSLIINNDINELLNLFDDYQPILVNRWGKPTQS